MESKAPKTAYFTLLLYITGLILNIIFLSGRVFPYNFVGYLNQSPNPLFPWIGTFLIWPLLLIGLFFVVMIPLRSNLVQQFRNDYQLRVEKRIQLILLFMIVLVIIHGFGDPFPTLLLMPFYLNQVDKVMQVISSTTSLRSTSHILKWPVGLLYGWSVGYFIAFTGSYATPLIDQFSPLVFYGGILILILALMFQTYYTYIKLGNEAIVPGFLWYFLGLLLQFILEKGNTVVPQVFIYIIAILLIAGLLYYLYLLRLQSKQRQK